MSAFAGVLFPIARPRITLPFADRTYRAYRLSPHRGLDVSPYPGALGAPIRASSAGQVAEVNLYGNTRAIGNEIVIKTALPFAVTARNLAGDVILIDARETIWLRYGHLSRCEVTPGDTIDAGVKLGEIGSTGLSSGPHVHVEVRHGVYSDGLVLDPLDVLIMCIVGLRQTVEYAT